MTACDAYAVDQMSEEEILACLVAEPKPTFTVPTKKAKLKELKEMIEKKEEAPLDKYQKENLKLQQVNLQLEQENDNLAHRLITSKITLMNALNKTEDSVDKLTKDLLQARRKLQATEEEKRGIEEGAEMLKEVFRRELEKAEQEVRRSSIIIADYKQICSQLTNRLEKQQAAHREELDALKSIVKACPHCQHLIESEERSSTDKVDHSSGSTSSEGGGRPQPGRGEDRNTEQRLEDQDREDLSAQISVLEQDLAQTKLQVVEANCKIQELEHQKGILTNDLQEAKNTWFNKAFTSLRTSSGGIHSINPHRDRGPTAGWNVQSPIVSGWSTKKLSWAHRDTRGNV